MPELPEVETFRRNLEQGRDGFPAILGKTIQDAQILWERTLAAPSPMEFLDRVQGQSVESLGRRGKHLLIYLSSDTLVLHFRMSGEVIVEPQTAPLGKHYRLILDFTDGYRLVFNNPRKFGRVWLTPQPDILLSDLGPEPLANDFHPQDLHAILNNHHRQIKYLLLDQTKIAGLGNIYTDESLHRSKIHPRTKSDSLSLSQATLLWESIRQVLQTGINNQGASIDWMYKGGDYQRLLRVYKRTGDPCIVCGTPIERILVAQRGTHYCPSCQPPPPEDS